MPLVSSRVKIFLFACRWTTPFFKGEHEIRKVDPSHAHYFKINIGSTKVLRVYFMDTLNYCPLKYGVLASEHYD